MSGTPLLSLAIWIPILAGFVVLATGSDRNAPLARTLSLIGAVAGLLVTIPLYTGFDMLTSAMQFVELSAWIPRFNINYHLGVDGISMLFVILNSFITVIVVLAGWKVIDQQGRTVQRRVPHHVRVAEWYFLPRLTACCSTSSSKHRSFPLYLIIGVWGGPNRVYAAFKFFPVYADRDRLLFLVAMIYLFVQFGWELLDPRLASVADWAHGSDLDLPCLPRGIRRQGAHVAGTYVVA
jgi:NADH-quinone oxidoreductase subunit M